MAVGTDNNFAEETEEMTFGKFKMWTVKTLWIYLFLRNESSEGDFKSIVYRLALLFRSANVFWSTWNRSMKTLLMIFTYEAVASTI